MTSFDQDKILLQDILKRNYYQFFEKNTKSISLTFFYNLKYTNLKYIENFDVPTSNTDTIKENFIHFLDWYIKNNFICDIKIQDEFWLYDEDFYTFIFSTFLNYIKNKDLKCQQIIIKTKLNSVLNNLENLQKIIDNFKQEKVSLIFSLETELISLGNINIFNTGIFEFLSNNNFKLKIQINPNNFAYFDQIIFQILEKYRSFIYLYEEANYGWTEYKNKEYFEFLEKYINFYQNIYKDDFFNQLLLNKIDLFHLQDKGILDATGSCVGGCSFYNSLCLLLEDFSINLCPKFQFDDQVIGNFILENDDLVPIPKHLDLISMNVHLKRHSTSHCETCILLPFCDGCCCKSSYDVCLNPIIPVRQFCEMQNHKFGFLFNTLYQKKLFSKEIINKNTNISDLYKIYLIMFLPPEEAQT